MLKKYLTPQDNGKCIPLKKDPDKDINKKQTKIVISMENWIIILLNFMATFSGRTYSLPGCGTTLTERKSLADLFKIGHKTLNFQKNILFQSNFFDH